MSRRHTIFVLRCCISKTECTFSKGCGGLDFSKYVSRAVPLYIAQVIGGMAALNGTAHAIRVYAWHHVSLVSNLVDMKANALPKRIGP